MQPDYKVWKEEFYKEFPFLNETRYTPNGSYLLLDEIVNFFRNKITMAYLDGCSDGKRMVADAIAVERGKDYRTGWEDGNKGIFQASLFKEHIFVTPDDGTRFCKVCGQYLTHDLHKRNVNI